MINDQIKLRCKSAPSRFISLNLSILANNTNVPVSSIISKFILIMPKRKNSFII